MVGQSYSQTVALRWHPRLHLVHFFWFPSGGFDSNRQHYLRHALSRRHEQLHPQSNRQYVPNSADSHSRLSIAVGAAFQISTSSPLPPGLGGNPYNVKIQASGGTTPYSFTLASGAPPAGLTLQSDGTLSGVPSTAGSFLFSVMATDSTTPTPQTQIKPLAITITPPLSISTSSLPRGLVGTSYAQSLLATGGTPSYSWSITSGALPQGLTLSPDGSLLEPPPPVVPSCSPFR